MEEIRAIIIDDEHSAINVLSNLLKRASPEIKIVASCQGFLEGIKEINIHKPDVVFLDIQMPNYAGYEIVDYIDEINFEIIFVTAHDQYAIKAFELNAIDYLVKPIDRQKLQEALEKLEKKLLREYVFKDYKKIVNHIRDKNQKKIVIPELGNRRILNLEDIIAIEADGAYTTIHLVNNKIVTTSKNLKYFENKLTDENSFFRTHRAWIVNINYLELINKTSRTITFRDSNIVAKIARTKQHEFEKLLTNP